ncbi:MAG TPA: MFS transporter [Bacteroidales bacterium]|nr:MFS transporter [Bacteroidales bacterium]HPZ36123.1 MFS transporter [Bacteroidales bacterium]HQD34430.1 MFS transporter [Bacteroidales bacterium]
MFKNHPKGLVIAFFSNMGERFGFYTMMAILVLFLQAKFGLSAESAGSIYSWFYFAIYALALVGGIIADSTKRYKLVVLVGLIVMLLGYVMMTVPGTTLAIAITGLMIIALGNGLFKGNLQAIVGQLYDNPKYESLRDTGYLLFYMGINIGAFFAPFAATGIRNWFLKINGFVHDASLPSMCHAYLDGQSLDIAKFQDLANSVSSAPVADLSAFAHQYIDVFSRGYNYAFGIAALAMVVSLLVFLFYQKSLPDARKIQKEQKAKEAQEHKETTPVASFPIKNLIYAIISFVVLLGIFWFAMGNIDIGFAVALFGGFITYIILSATPEEKPKITSLVLVFFVVIFFWMSFHQNGLTLTLFARDYVAKEVGAFTALFFDLKSLFSIILAISGIVMIFTSKKLLNKVIAAVFFIGFGYLTYYFYQMNAGKMVPIAPELFQSFNPLFIVALTFPINGLFSWLRSKGKEPSTPRKIGIGMFIAALAYVIMIFSSTNLTSPSDVAQSGITDYNRVTPFWLISTYLTLTVAELFLSPMGLSFVSKVAPKRFQGLMQGGWLLTTAVGNKLLFLGTYFWERVELWQLWLIFVSVCALSGLLIFALMKRLEKATS